MYYAGDVADGEASDRVNASISHVDHMRRGPPLDQSNTCFFKASYNGPIPCNVAASNASIAWNTDHQPHQRTCLIGSVITVQIRSRRKHLDRRMKIQRTRFKAFYNASRGIQSGPLIKIGRSRLNRNGPRWTVSS